jgi:arylformamidase
MLNGIHDISLVLNQATVLWPNTNSPERSINSHVDRGDVATVSSWTVNSHLGTHVDAPSHFIAGGKDITSVSLERHFGRCVVLDLTHVVGRDIERTDLEHLPELDGHTRVLLKTSNSRDLLGLDQFETGYVALGESAAELLLERGVILVGIDYYSIERFETSSHPTHMALLAAECGILEGADLRAVAPGEYVLVCLPLLLEGSEASPVRALLVEPSALAQMLESDRLP